jgi:tetratricopeptide (TPR) repeat protein
MKINYTRTAKFTLAMLMLLAVQCSNVFAQNITKIYKEKKFKEVLSAIDPVLIENKANPAYLSKLYFIRGSSRFNLIYQARTGRTFGADNVFDEKRPRFELIYEDSFINLINGAIGDLQKAVISGQESTKTDVIGSTFTYDLNFETEILDIQALAHLEKAQFITNSYADFSEAYRVFKELDSIHNANISRFGGKFGEDNTRVKSGEMLAAEIKTKVALGEIDEAILLYEKWQKANGYSLLKKQLAIPATVEAFDLVGNYKYSEAFLIREAIRQITIDKGKIVPANFTLLKTAMKSHLYNINYAIQIPPTGKMLPFRRARLVSAYNFKGNLTPVESTFVKNAPDVIKAENKETPPMDVQLISVMHKLQSTDKKELSAARKTLEEMLKKDATNAAILAVRGYSKMLSEDFAGAETDLSAAIKKDPFLAFANKAFQNRALSYKKLGKVDLAAKDENNNNQFSQLLAFLAAP